MRLKKHLGTQTLMRIDLKHKVNVDSKQESPMGILTGLSEPPHPYVSQMLA